MKRSFPSRVRGAAQRWHHRVVYERMRPELAVEDVRSRLQPEFLGDAGSRPFSHFLATHLAHTPTRLWSLEPPASAGAVADARAGRTSLLNRAIHVSPATDWHRDPFFGSSWPRRYTGALSLARQGGDVVPLWHLNKMMFLLDLAAAYRATRDPALAARVYDLIDSWCAANPYCVGINWVSPLDIATRLTAWSQALAAIADAPLPDEDRAARIVRSFLRQVDYLASHWSEWPVPNNHLLGEVAMLFTVAAYGPIWKDAHEWRKRSEGVLIAELERQILDDGVQYEASVNYHAYALDFVLLYLHAKALLGETPPAAVLAKAHTMASAYLSLVLSSGRRPRMGDDSIDRGFVLSHVLDAPPLREGISMLRDSVRPAYSALLGSTRWGHDLLDVGVARRHARHFEQAGITIVRHEETSLAFAHGPQHRRVFSHGHMHADAGSFELEQEGVPIVIDAGTYVYFADPTARTYFKGARAHNAPVIDDVEPMRSVEPFRWESIATGEFQGFGSGPDCAGIGNRRKLQATGGTPIEHTRALVLSRGTVLVVDAIRVRDASPISQSHTVRVCFRTPTPRGTAESDGVRARVADPRRFTRVFEAFADQPVRVDVVDGPGDRAGWYSPCYGDLQHGSAVVVSTEFESGVVLVSAIRATDVAVVPERIGGEETVVGIESHGERRLVRVRWEPFSIVVGGRTMVGRGASTGVHPSPPAARGSGAPEWLDELTLG